MAEILHGVYPEPVAEILHFVQNDRRRVQIDKDGIFLITTQSLKGEGGTVTELDNKTEKGYLNHCI